MGDLMLQRRNDGYFDLFFDGGDLLTGESLENAVIISIGSISRLAGREFTAELHDDGWWGESTNEDDSWGAELQALVPGKSVPNVELRARQSVQEALKWIVDDGIAEKIDVSAVASSESLDLSIDITRGGTVENYRYNVLWSEVA